MWGLLLRVVCFPVRLPWIKLIFHWQLFISWKWHLGYKWGLVSTSSLIWGTPPDAYLCGPLVWCHKVSVSSCVYQSYCVYRALFPWCYSAIRSLTLFLLPLPHSFLRPEGRGLLGDVPFRGECSMASHFLHIVCLGVFFPMYRRRTLLWWWLSNVIIYEYHRMSFYYYYVHVSLIEQMYLGFCCVPVLPNLWFLSNQHCCVWVSLNGT